MSQDLHHALYLPRYLMGWQSRPGAVGHDTVDDTLLMADMTGFTQLSEELSAQGRIGSEQVTDLLNRVFSELLDIAGIEGGDLFSFGGDALLLLYHGEQHALRAAQAAHDMQDALEETRPADSEVSLRLSIGLATGPIHFVLAGSTSREMITIGDVVDQAIEVESAAEPGQVLLAASTASLLDPDLVGRSQGPGFALAGAPDPDFYETSAVPLETADRYGVTFLASDVSSTGR